jgi:outer membrane immunogenic protein
MREDYCLSKETGIFEIDFMESNVKKVLSTTAALITLGPSLPALAADLPARTYTKAPAYAAMPIYNWTGFYIGGHIGSAFTGDNGFAGMDAKSPE